MSNGHEILASIDDNVKDPDSRLQIYRYTIKDWTRTKLTDSAFSHRIGDWKPDYLTVSPKYRLTRLWGSIKREEIK